MPKITVYLRKENQAQWDSLPDKSAWFNAHLEADARVTQAGLPPSNVVELPETPKPSEPYYDPRLGRMVS